MKYNDLIDVLDKEGLLVLKDKSDATFTSVAYDSRDVLEGSIFVCKGLNFKKDYLLMAIEKGARGYIAKEDYDVDIPKIIVSDVLKAMAVVSKKIYDDPNKKLCLIGTTGTKGKTTITSFIRNILSHEIGKKCAYWTTIDNYDGSSSSSSHNTTPESVDIYKTIRGAKDHDIPYMMMEVSSQAKKLERIYGINFDIGVFINVSCDHISPLEHKDFNEYLNCKVGFLKQCKTVFLYRNIDHYDYIREELKDKTIYTFGDSDDCDYKYSNIVKKDNGTYFDVRTPKGTKTYMITIAGNFNVINATAAIGVTELLNASYKNMLLGLEETSVLGRMSVYQGGKCPIIVDYAHNKISVQALMDALRSDYPGKNIKLVFGCPGDRGVNRREEVGTLAGKYASYVYLTAEDPQTKKVRDICKDIIPHIEAYNKPYEIIEDREEAIKKAVKDATSDDVIAIIGKGDETYQIVNYEYVPYKSDIGVVEELVSLVNEK